MAVRNLLGYRRGGRGGRARGIAQPAAGPVAAGETHTVRFTTEPTIVEAIRIVRRAQGVSQGDLAAAARITRTQLNRIERGNAEPYERTIYSLIAALGYATGTALVEAAVELAS
jgi:ribosome-binding protein aMBF1 (putative translation factor)